jgi:anti-sigma B factor antagonist
VCVVTVCGDVDIATVAILDRALESAIGGDVRHVVVDLAAVTFLDSTGLRALVHCAQGLDERGGLLTCTQLSDRARRTMELTGLVGYLTRPLPDTAE